MSGSTQRPDDHVETAIRVRENLRQTYYDAAERLHLAMSRRAPRQQVREALRQADKARDEWVNKAADVQYFKAKAYDAMHGEV